MKKGRFCYAASENCADLLYLSGFSAPDAFLWLEFEGQQFIVVSPLEYGRACRQARDDIRVLSYEDAKKLFGIKNLKISQIIAGASRIANVWNWETPGHCPLSLVEAIHKTNLKTLDGKSSGEKISIKAFKGDFCPERMVKTADEAEKLRQAENIAQAGLARALQIIGEAKVAKNGNLRWNGENVTSEMLQGEINAEIARNGGAAAGTIVAHGIQGAFPHNTGEGAICADEPIVIDIFPRCCATGYFGDLTRTVVKGKAPDIVKKAFEAVYDAQRTVLQMLKPGVKGIEAHKKADDVMKAHGFKTDLKSETPYGFIHGLGHGVGLEIHEKPSLNLRNPKPLVAGNVVTIEPGLYYPEWGGIRIEDMAMITEDGIDNFTNYPVFLEIE